MSKIKKIKQLKLLKKTNERRLVSAKAQRKVLFDNLCRARGKLYYRDNPLKQKPSVQQEIVADRVEGAGALSSSIQNAARAFKIAMESLANNITRQEKQLLKIDATILKLEELIKDLEESILVMKGE